MGIAVSRVGHTLWSWCSDATKGRLGFAVCAKFVPLRYWRELWNTPSTSVLNEPFVIPFVAAAASLCIHTVHTVLRYAVYRWKSPSDEADAQNGPTLRPVDPTTAYYLFEQRKDENGNFIFGYTLARLFGCLTLLVLSTKTLLTCSTLREHGTLSLRHIFSKCPEAFITVSLVRISSREKDLCIWIKCSNSFIVWYWPWSRWLARNGQPPQGVTISLSCLASWGYICTGIYGLWRLSVKIQKIPTTNSFGTRLRP